MAAGKNKKHNRNKLRNPSSVAYKSLGKKVKNAAIKQARHAAKHPNDKQPVGTKTVYVVNTTRLLPKQLAQLQANRRWNSYLKGVV